MSDEPTERDVEALARETCGRNEAACAVHMDQARAVLASDWYAKRIAEAEQRGREDNADHGMCYVSGSKALAAREAQARREVVEAVEKELDDADQIRDSLEHPNYITVWGVRRTLYPFGGREHRWQVPAERCAECGHLAWNHNDDCVECDCLLSRREAEWGRDEALDETIREAIWEDAVTNDEPWTRDDA